jgi:hypothetical protein
VQARPGCGYGGCVGDDGRLLVAEISLMKNFFFYVTKSMPSHGLS